MVETMFIECLFFLLVITRIHGSGIPWRQENLSVGERTMETILESCYENDSSSTPIVIIGDYNGRVYGSSVIRLSHIMGINKYSRKRQFRAPASKVIIIGKSSEQIFRSIIRLRKTIWWRKEAHFFILAQNHEKCENSEWVLDIASVGGIPNFIFICSISMNQSSLMTINWIGDYAPYPWKKYRPTNDSYHVFYQHFNPRSSCTNLQYDKTTILNGFEIMSVALSNPNEDKVKSGKKYMMNVSKLKNNYHDNTLDGKVIQSIIMKLNASFSMQFADNIGSMFEHCMNGSANIALASVQVFGNPRISCLFPYSNNEIVAIVKLNQEVSTLEKIYHLWSTVVLIFAAIALAILYIILTIMNHDPSLALLDLTRLLIYSSIFRISNRHSFRIYFTTMLIFMVISNGVFQGKIAAFLTTRERKHAIQTIDKLLQLDYKIYTFPHMSRLVTYNCPKCKAEEVPAKACVNYVLNSTRRVCVMAKHEYEKHFNLLPLDHVEEPVFITPGTTLCHQKEWVLADSATRIIIRLLESGLINIWKERPTYEARMKRQAKESEWSSPEYRPVKLYKLDFAFYGLALGLFISTIAFVLELLVANCNLRKKCNYPEWLN